MHDFPAIATSQAFPAEIGSFFELCRKKSEKLRSFGRASVRCTEGCCKSNDRSCSAANGQGNLGNGALALMWITCVV